MYKAIDVANYIINKSIDNKCPISNLKLQKLLYYVQAAKLVQTDGNETLFYDNICAWKYGPVVEDVYHKFKSNLNQVIKDKQTLGPLRFQDGRIIRDEYNPYNIISDADKVTINKVITSYRKYTPMGIMRKTHEEWPWISASEQDEKIISNQSIYEYYNANKDLIYGIER